MKLERGIQSRCEMSFKFNGICSLKELMHWISFEKDDTSKLFDM